MVVFPQTPELSTSRPQIAKNRQQGFAQGFHQVAHGQNRHFHTSTTPYYNYSNVSLRINSNRRRDNRL